MTLTSKIIHCLMLIFRNFANEKKTLFNQIYIKRLREIMLQFKPISDIIFMVILHLAQQPPYQLYFERKYKDGCNYIHGRTLLEKLYRKPHSIRIFHDSSRKKYAQVHWAQSQSHQLCIFYLELRQHFNYQFTTLI